VIHIRDAGPRDAADIVRLVRALAAEGGESCALTEALAARYLAAPGCHVLLAEADGDAVVGLLSCSIRLDLYHAAPTCLVEELVVQDGWRGQGVGSQLLEAAIALAQGDGCAEISVSTMPDNLRAQAFYRRHGLVDEAVLLERHF
jgi:ribosomal protein S18 acetylase RimI-like enzyme